MADDTGILKSQFNPPLTMSDFTFLGQTIPRLTLLVGGALVVEGLGVYLGTGMTSLASLFSNDFSASTIAQLLMIVMGGVYTFACIRSFTHARKAREAAAAES